MVPLRALRQVRPLPLVKFGYNEVVRSLVYAPAYVVIAKGYVRGVGLDVELATANGGEAVPLSASPDIALMDQRPHLCA
ncbi:MAG TPA: hypothetical protein VGJ20_31365 [Xanthobacteraceae bacterium]